MLRKTILAAAIGVAIVGGQLKRWNGSTWDQFGKVARAEDNLA